MTSGFPIVLSERLLDVIVRLNAHVRDDFSPPVFHLKRFVHTSECSNVTSLLENHCLLYRLFVYFAYLTLLVFKYVEREMVCSHLTLTVFLHFFSFSVFVAFKDKI